MKIIKSDIKKTAGINFLAFSSILRADYSGMDKVVF